MDELTLALRISLESGIIGILQTAQSMLKDLSHIDDSIPVEAIEAERHIEAAIVDINTMLDSDTESLEALDCDFDEGDGDGIII